VSNEVEFNLEGSLYDRMAVFLFSNAIRGNVTSTQPDAINEPNHRLWSFEPALTTPNTPDQANGIDTFTLEWSDGNQAREAEHLFATAIEITGTVNEEVKYTWEAMGRRVTSTTLTPALSVPATRAYYAVNNAKLYIDTSYANLGTTQITGVLKEFTWRLETMFTPRYTADGNLYFTALNEDAKEATLELVFQYDSSTVPAEVTKFINQTTAYIRLELLSQTEMDSGQANPSYVWLDGAYKYSEVPELDDEDGVSLLTMSAKTFYDTTAAKQFGAFVGTTMSAFA
jgi:hypothetical protein